jgi:hypothetical protein
MSAKEVATADQLQKRGVEATVILEKLQRSRSRLRDHGPSKSSVQRLLSGSAYVRGRSEARGRKPKMPKGIIRTANAERLKLIKSANNDYLVTWADIRKATKTALKAQGRLTRGYHMPGEDWLARKMRETCSVRARPGKRKITRKADHEQRRYTQALQWVKYPASWWEEEIHGYLDTKAFVCPRSAFEKRLMRATKVAHHLRTPSEGNLDACVLPKKSHSLFGIPSVEITAAVGQDRIIMWHEVEGRWNGDNAALMYRELGVALRRCYGKKREFRVVEDLDTKGFQSGKGIRAKKLENIDSWKLPPRSPGWMPLDFSLWTEIENRVLGKYGYDTEDTAAYAKRLRLTAMRLPKTVIKKCLAKMKGNIQETVASRGKHTSME